MLDIDECLNSVSNTIRCYQRHISSHDFQGLNPISVALLRELVQLSEAKIVLSSTWRLHYKTFDACLNDFEEHMERLFHWPEFPLIGMTDDLPGCRGDEIKQWLDLHYCSNYVIIDDSRDMLDSQLHHFVRCDYREGFNFKNFVQCLEIFDITSDFRTLLDPN